MHPLLLVLVGAAGGAFVASRASAAKQQRADLDIARQKALDMAAGTLLSGHTYAVQIMVDPRAPQWGGPAAPRDLASASDLIRRTYEPAGWRVRGAPALAVPATASSFLAGRPALWVFLGTWTRPERFQSFDPGFATMTLAQEVPAVPGT